MYPPTANRAYYPALDILRGVAIIIVVFYHNFEFLSIFRFGWMGVDLFFVLSGFLITDLLLKTRENKFFFRNFYVRRFLRIFPLYYLVLLVFFSLSPFLFSQKDPNSTFAYYNDNKVWFWAYLQNWLMVDKGMAPVPFLSHFWSLAIEEQFYIFWPMMVFFIRDIKKLKIVTIILVFIAMIYRIYTWNLFPGSVETFYCSTFTRMDSLLMGCLLAVHLKQGKKISPSTIHLVSAAFILLLSGSLLILGNVRQDNIIFPTVGYTIAAAFFACMLYLLITKEVELLGWLKHLKPLSFLGKISYGIYVFHIPIYLLLSSLFTESTSRYFSSAWESTVFISLLSVVVTLIASTFSFYLLEKPILNLKKHFP